MVEAVKEEELSSKAKRKAERERLRQQRKTVLVTLQLIPMFIGLVGLFLISSWSLDFRVKYPEANTPVYYLGIALILFALQVPLMLEAFRRKTKRFLFRRVLFIFIVIASLLIVSAYHLAPEIDDDALWEAEDYFD